MNCLGHISQLGDCIFQKTATAVAHCKRGNGLIKVNGRPLDLIEPAMLRYKVCFTSIQVERNVGVFTVKYNAGSVIIAYTVLFPAFAHSNMYLIAPVFQ